MPAARARSNIWRLIDSSASPPKASVPKARDETATPVSARNRYFMKRLFERFNDPAIWVRQPRVASVPPILLFVSLMTLAVLTTAVHSRSRGLQAELVDVQAAQEMAED